MTLKLVKTGYLSDANQFLDYHIQYWFRAFIALSEIRIYVLTSSSSQLSSPVVNLRPSF